MLGNNEVAKEGLSKEDLGLALADCILLGPGRRVKENMWIFEVEYENKRFKIGVIGEEVLASVARNGYVDKAGRKHLRIPQTALREGKIGWLNTPY
jgi:hypothetical protein